MSAAISSSPTPALRPLPLLPGSRGLLGHLPAFRSNAAKWLLGAAATGLDAARAPLGFVRRAATISSPALVNEILVTKHASFIKTPGMSVFLRPVLGDGLLTSEDQPHERARRLLAPAFTPKRMAGYAAIFSERAARFASALEHGTTLDLADSMMALTLEVVGKTLFDAEVGSDAGTVGAALTTGMEVAIGQLSSVVPIPPKIPTPGNLRYRSAVKDLDQIIYRIIDARRAAGEDRGDVLSVLLAAKDEDGTPMSDRQVRDEAMTLFLAGHETTANALAWTFYLLARHPEVRAKLEAELDRIDGTPSYDDAKKMPYTLAVLKEAMRLYPPAFLIGRRAREDVVIGDYLFKKGTILFLNVIGIHHNADLWPDPERFDPERFIREDEKQLPRCAYMPFGAGPRVCIGNHFALAEGQLLLAAIAKHARFELTDPTRPVDLEPLVTLRPKGGIGVRVALRQPGATASA